MPRRLINIFNGGETTSLLGARHDNERALTGCSVMQNMMPKAHGAAVQRPPFEFMGLGAGRLIPFNFNTSQKFVLRLLPQPADITGENAALLFYVHRQDGTIAQAATMLPWIVSNTVADLARIQYFQENDIVWLVHPSNPPLRIIRYAETKWLWELYWPTWPALGIEAQEWVSTQEPVAASSTHNYSLDATVTTAWAQDSAEPFRLELFASASVNWVGTIRVQYQVPAHTRLDGTAVAAGAVIELGGAGAEITNVNVGASKTLVCDYPQAAMVAHNLTPDLLPAAITWRLVITRTSGNGSVSLAFKAAPTGLLESTSLDLSTAQSSVGAAVSYSILRSTASIFTDADFAPVSLSTAIGANINDPSGQNGRTGINQGERYRIGHIRDGSKLALGLSATGTSGTLRMWGAAALSTTGIWHGTIYVEAQDDISPADWEILGFWDASGNRNIQAEVEVGSYANVRLRFVDAAGTPASSPTAYLQPVQTRGYGIVERVKVPGATSGSWCIVRIHEPLISTKATRYWQREAWTYSRGFPKTLIKHEKRMWFGGTTTWPQMLWGSEVDEPLNLSLGSFDADPVVVALQSNAHHSIEWITSLERGIAVGTRGDEWVVDSGDGRKAITPSAIQARQQSFHGSSSIPASTGDDAVLYVQRGGRRVREFSFSFERDSYVSIDLSVFAEHMTRAGIAATCYTSNPDGTLWVLLGDGTLHGLVYERVQQVVAWFRVVTDGLVESVCSLFGDDGKADEVWAVVSRGGTRCIERFVPSWWTDLDARNVSAMCYADSRITHFAASPVTSIPVPPHLNGKSLAITRDGVPQPNATASGGIVTVPSGAGTFRIGLPYEAKLTLHRMEEQMQTGTAQGSSWRVSEVLADLWNSYAADVRYGSTWEPLPVQTWEEWTGPNDGALKSGLIKTRIESQHSLGSRLEIRNTTPLPLAVLALMPTYEVYG